MSSRYGGKIVTDGLVLCLDAHDAKSYAGEPTTNLVTSTAVDFSVRSTYSGNTFSQVADSESPSGYACEMSYTGTVNSASRCRFGAATNIPTSGTGFVSIWAKRSGGSSTTMRPKVYTGYAWYHLEPLDGGSIYFTDEYRPFGVAVTFGTNSGGPNPGFSMTHAGGSTENDKTRWIKPQVTTLSYNTPFANLSRSATDGWKDRTANSYDGTLVNMAGTGASHYKNGQVIMPVSASYLDFDGTNDYIDLGTTAGNFGTDPFTVSVWLNFDALGSFYNKYAADQDQILFSHSGGKPYFIYNAPNGTDYGYTVSNTTISTGTWYNFVATVDRSSNFPVIYVNGVNDGSSLQSSAGSPTTANMDNGGNLIIGRGLYSGNYSYFNGKMSQLLIYKGKALTAAEVLSNYNTTKSRFS